jgi:hypothetical protein
MRKPDGVSTVSSPVLNQPSAVNDALVSSGRRQYSRKTVGHERVRERHPDLGHAVALEQPVPREPLPFLHHGDGQRGRARDEQAELARGGLPAEPRHLVGRRVLAEQLRVDRGDGHEERETVVAEALPRARRVELEVDRAARARAERAQDHVDDAVHVVQGEHEQHVVARLPAPRFVQRSHLREQAGVRVHDALGTPGGSGRVEHERGALGGDLGEGRVAARACREQLGDVAHGDPERRGGSGRAGQMVRVRHDQLGGGVLERLPELGLGGGERQRDHHPTGLPDAQHRGDPLEARRDQHRDPRFGEIGSAFEQRGRRARGGLEELAVDEGASSSVQRDGVGPRAGLLEEGKAQVSNTRTTRRRNR